MDDPDYYDDSDESEEEEPGECPFMQISVCGFENYEYYIYATIEENQFISLYQSCDFGIKLCQFGTVV